MLVGRAYVCAIDLFGARQQVHVVQAAYELAVFDEEWNFVGADFEHGAGSLDLAGTVAEAGIEESGVVNAEFTVGGIERNHFGGEVGRDADSFPGGKNIKVAGLENQILVGV